MADCFKPVGEVLLPRRSGILSSSLSRHQRFQSLCNYRLRIQRARCLWGPSRRRLLFDELGANSMDHVDESINGCWSWALYAIEGEIPPSAAMMTITKTKVPIVKDSQPGIGRLLVEKTFLWKLILKQAQRWKLRQLITQLFRMIYSTATKFGQWDPASAKTFPHSTQLPL